MKTYHVWVKPCEDYPDGIGCFDPRKQEDETGENGLAVFYTKKRAKGLVEYLCSEEWGTDSKPEDYEIVCSHDVRYCVWHRHTMQPCGDVIGGGNGGSTFIAKTKKEAKKALNSWLDEVGFPSENYAVAELIIPKKKVS